jgi:hypothetical protein
MVCHGSGVTSLPYRRPDVLGAPARKGTHAAETFVDEANRDTARGRARHLLQACVVELGNPWITVNQSCTATIAELVVCNNVG